MTLAGGGDAASRSRGFALSFCGVGTGSDRTLNPTSLWQGDVNSINWNDPNAKLSKHFTVKDALHTYSPTYIRPEYKRYIITLAHELDKIAEMRPIQVQSWYRSNLTTLPPSFEELFNGFGDYDKGINVTFAFGFTDRNDSNIEFLNYLRRNWGGIITFEAYVVPQDNPQNQTIPQSSLNQPFIELKHVVSGEMKPEVFLNRSTNMVKLSMVGDGRLNGKKACLEQNGHGLSVHSN